MVTLLAGFTKKWMVKLSHRDDFSGLSRHLRYTFGEFIIGNGP